MIHANRPPILLTSSVIVADQSVNLKDTDLRVKFTLESIGKWLKQSSQLRIVVCDGSNFDFSKIVAQNFPGANIECLFFRNDTALIEKHGKGFGEGEIIKYALQNSDYLKDSVFFGKCTAKLWVENFHECLKDWNGQFLCKGFFSDVFSLKETKFSYVDTRFYLVSKEFYEDNFFAAHLTVGADTGLSIEDCFLNIIVEKKMNKIFFNTPPVICGVGGGSGTYYKNNLKRRLKEVIRLKLVKKNPKFNSLFA